MKSKLAWAVLSVVLAGCSTSWLETKKVDYKSAGKLPQLEIPPDLSAPGRDERYAVPDIDSKGSATFSTYSGERGGQVRTTVAQDLLPQIEKMRIERSGTQRWLVVPGVPAKLWPSVKEFWQGIGFIVDIERPEAGVIETDWAENRAKLPQDIVRSTVGKIFDDVYSTAERDKFRTRLEQGGEAGTTEIYITHRGMYEVYVTEGKDQTRWEPRPPDPELEAEMLRRLMVHLGVTDAKAKELLATSPNQPRAKLTAVDGSGALEVEEAFDRAWRRVGLSLDRVGFTVEDRDRSKGIYYVRYVDPGVDGKKKDDDKGFVAKLMFWKDGDKPGQTDATGKYRVYLKGNVDTTTVQVLTNEGGVDKSDTSKRILALLLDQLK